MMADFEEPRMFSVVQSSIPENNNKKNKNGKSTIDNKTVKQSLPEDYFRDRGFEREHEYRNYEDKYYNFRCEIPWIDSGFTVTIHFDIDEEERVKNAKETAEQTVEELRSSLQEVGVLTRVDTAMDIGRTGTELFLEGNFEDAIEKYDEAIEINPLMPSSWLNRSHAYWRLGDLDQALSDAEQAVTLHEDNTQAHLTAGLLNIDLSNTEEAERYFDEAADLLGNKSKIYATVSCSCQEKDWYAPSAKYAKRALENDSENYHALFHFINCSITLGHHSKALSKWETHGNINADDKDMQLTNLLVSQLLHRYSINKQPKELAEIASEKYPEIEDEISKEITSPE